MAEHSYTSANVSEYAIKPTAEQIVELSDYLLEVNRGEDLILTPTMPEWYAPIAATLQANTMLGEENKLTPWQVDEGWIPLLAAVWQATTRARVMINREAVQMKKQGKRLNDISIGP